MDNLKLKICNWLKDQIAFQNKKALLINIEDDNIYSILNYYFCKSTQIPVHAVIKNANNQLSKNYCINNNIPYSIFQSSITLESTIININYPGSNRIIYNSDYNKIYELEKTALISYIADTTNSLFVSNLTRNDYYFIRNFPKVNAYDLLPFVNFSETELTKMVEFFKIEAFQIHHNTPLIRAELEWIYELNKRTNIIEREELPTSYPKWYSYTADQKALIAKVYQEEKLTRHKKCNGETFNA